MEVQEIKEQLKSIFRQVINNDKWITIHPNGEDGKGRPLLLKDGESPKEAIARTYGNGKQANTQKEKKDTPKKREIEHNGAKISIIPDGKYSDIKIDAPEGKAFKNGDTWYRTESLTEKAEELAKKIIDDEFGKSDTKDGEEDFEKGTKSTKKDEDRHQKVRDLEDKAYKEFKTIYDNYIDKDGIEGWGGIPASRFDKAKEQFNKKYKDAFDKLESDRFVSFEDFAKRENKQSESKREKKERLRIVYKDDKDPDGSIVGIFEDEHGEYQALTPTVSKTFKTISGAERFLASRGFENPNKADNSKEQDMALLEELKKLITKVENTKGEKDMEIENEKVDKRKLIDEVAGIMKSAGCDDEVIRTAIGKMEKMSYDDSEKSADNECEDKEDVKNCGKKVKNEDEEDKKEVEEIEEDVKEDVENRGKKNVKNSKTDYFAKLNEIYNSAANALEKCEYVSRADREKAAEDYFTR